MESPAIGGGESFVTCCDTSSTSSTLILSMNQSCSTADVNFIESLEHYLNTAAAANSQQANESRRRQIKPKFYLLLKSRNSSYDSTSELKLDGIALNLLVTNNTTTAKDADNCSTVVDYNRLYSALVRLLDAGLDHHRSLSVVDNNNKTIRSIEVFAAAAAATTRPSVVSSSQFNQHLLQQTKEYIAIPYTFYMTWRLLSNMPPSIDYLAKLNHVQSSGQQQSLNNGHMHYLRSIAKYASQPSTSTAVDIDVVDYLHKQDPKVDVQMLLKRIDVTPLADQCLFVSNWSHLLTINDDESTLLLLLDNIHLIDYHLGLLVIGANSTTALATFLMQIFGRYECLLKAKQFDGKLVTWSGCQQQQQQQQQPNTKHSNSIKSSISFLRNGLNAGSHQLNPNTILNIDRLLPKNLAVFDFDMYQSQNNAGAGATKCETIYKLRFTNIKLSIYQLLADCLKCLLKLNKTKTQDNNQQESMQMFFIRLNCKQC